jgi:hypothetical protein
LLALGAHTRTEFYARCLTAGLGLAHI